MKIGNIIISSAVTKLTFAGLLFLMLGFWQPLVSQAANLSLNPSTLKKEVTDLAVEKIFNGIANASENQLKTATYFNELVRDLQPFGVKLSETSFNATAREIYRKYQEAYAAEKDPVKARQKLREMLGGDIKKQVTNIIYNSLDKGSQEVISDLKGVYGKAKGELEAILELNKELEKDPKADWTKLARKYGVKGEFLEKLEKLEGRFNEAAGKYGDYYEASKIFYRGISGHSGDKVEALFELGEKFGGKIPILGNFVELYFKVANEMLKATGRLAKLLRDRQQGCLGGGTVGFIQTITSFTDRRNVAFSKRFKGVTACPVNEAIKFYQDIYEDINHSGQLYFWTGSGFIKGMPDHGGVDSVKGLRTWLREHNHLKEAQDINFIAAAYNLPPGFTTFKKEIEETVRKIKKRVDFLRNALYCLNAGEFNRIILGRGGFQQVIAGSNGAISLEKERRLWIYEPDLVNKLIEERYIQRRAAFQRACRNSLDRLSKIAIGNIRGEVRLKCGNSWSTIAGLPIEVNPAEPIVQKCSILTTSKKGRFYLLFIMDTDSSLEITMKADDGVNQPAEKTITLTNGHDPDYIFLEPTCKCGKGAELKNGRCVCKKGFEKINGKCVLKCGSNQVRNQDGECVCKKGFEKVDGQCVAKKCGSNQVRNQDGECVCKKGFEKVDGQCVAKKCGSNQVRNQDGECVCKKGFEKINGKCVLKCGSNQVRNQDGECVCKKGFEKVGGQCVAKKQNNICADDSDCPKGYVCYRGKCVFKKHDNTCTGDSDCPQGYVCYRGKCVFKKHDNTCTGDSDCPQGYVCYRGKCVSPFDSNYEKHTDTLTDRENEREQNVTDQVSTDQNTPDRNRFTSKDFDKDLDRTQDNILKICKNDSQCPSGFVCKNGQCVKQSIPTKPHPTQLACTGDSDCAQGQVCQHGVCVDKKTPARTATLTLSPANMAVEINKTVNLKAIFTDTDGKSRDVTSKAQWNPSPKFSKSKIGSYTVSASYQKLTATSQIAVVEKKGMKDVTVNKKTITVTFWDHGKEDGDMIDILINGKVVFPSITLTKAHQSRTITMNADAIVVGFRALNEGRISPNTATVTFTCVTNGEKTQKYSLKKNQNANMNVFYKP